MSLSNNSSDKDVQPQPPVQQAHEPVRDPTQSSETDTIKSGLKGLKVLGRRMTAQALGWRLLGDLHGQGVGTKEIERMGKKGISVRELDGLKGSRDPDYVKYQLKRRIQESKEDWERERKAFRQERLDLHKLASRCGKQSMLKKELKRIDRYKDHQFQKGRTKHLKKTDFLVNKYKQNPVKSSQSRQE